MERCNWKSLEYSQSYRLYHDIEWGTPSYDDTYLFEMLILESFHCGLSWLIILNKRESFRSAFDNFNPLIIKDYNEEKIKALLNNKNIVRHEGKIRATVNNSHCFLQIQKEFDSFSNYIWSFTNNKIIYGGDKPLVTKNDLSDIISKDLKKRGFKFMGSVTTYSYLEAIGVLNNHSKNCFRYKDK